VRGRAGGLAAISANELTIDRPPPTGTPGAEAPVREADADKDDGIRPPVLAASVNEWAVRGGCATGLLDLPVFFFF
jgi:hypothetical protein